LKNADMRLTNLCGNVCGGCGEAGLMVKGVSCQGTLLVASTNVCSKSQSFSGYH
jgi:hypothetical protein